MTTPRIFISHSHHDNAFGQQLVADLRGLLGEDAVWYDASGGLHGGDEWWDRIVAEITERTTFIVILSPEALASKWVPREMSIAYRLHVELGHHLIPIMFQPCQRRSDWALIQEVDFVAPRAYQDAFADLCGVLGIAATAVAAPAPAPVDRRSPVTQRLTQETHTAFGREDWSVVIDKTDVLIARNEMTPVLWRERGLALLAQRDARDALAALERALVADPDDVPTLRAKAKAQLALGQDDPAAQTLTLAQSLAALDDAATRLPLLDELYPVLVRLGRWPEAARRVQDALRLAPRDPAWVQRQNDVQTHPMQEQYDAASAKQDWPAALVACAAAILLAPGDAAWQQRHAHAQAQSEAARHAAEEAERQRKAQEEAERLRKEQERLRQEQERKDRLLPSRLRTLGFVLAPNAEAIIPPTVEVPAGPFTMGSDKKRDPDASKYTPEPLVSLTLPAFRIGVYPVTVAEYTCALAAKAKDVTQPNNWASQQQQPDHPVVYVSWLMASAYAAWLSQMTGEPWRLPTEAEWEKAARGTDGRIYPWGDQWDKARANTSDGGAGGTTRIGQYMDKDASPYGCHDMAGNVWEWTSSLWNNGAPYDKIKSENDSDRTNYRVLRGGSWGGGPPIARAAYRFRVRPDLVSLDLGVRLARGRAGT